VRVAIYTIALNEARHVERYLQACKGADTIVIADTGSTDGTPDALRRGGASVFPIAVRPWRFDDARNTNLALVPPDVDVCISLDLDEVLSDGWRVALERGWTPLTTMGHYCYVSSHLPDGAPAVKMRGAKIHSRFGYRWRHMCHEYLAEDRIAAPCETWIPDLQIDHWPDATKNRSGYLALLEAAVAETPDDPRDQFLLGREYVFLQRWDDAETVLRHYLAMPNARWPQQRASAWRRLGRCRNGKGDPEGAIGCIQEGLRLAPQMRDLWLDLADRHADMENWRASYDAALRGLAVPTGPGTIASDHGNAGGRPYYRASLAAWRLGRLDEAHALAVEADAREPGHPVYHKHLRQLGER
jgi:hypothetical protein